METAKFEAGKSYYARSACDHDCIFSYTVISRTAKTVTLEDEYGARHRRKINIDSEGEWLLPEGSFSMCPVLRAGRVFEKADAPAPEAAEGETPDGGADDPPTAASAEAKARRSNVIDFMAAKAKRDEVRKLEAAKAHFLHEILPYLSRETLARIAESIMSGNREEYQAEMTRALMEASARKA